MLSRVALSQRTPTTLRLPSRNPIPSFTRALHTTSSSTPTNRRAAGSRLQQQLRPASQPLPTRRALNLLPHPHLPPISRSYHHSSPHALASQSRRQSDSRSSTSQAARHGGESPVPGGSHGVAYSRHELVASWHAAAREISPLDVEWKGKDSIEANYRILHEDGRLEHPKDKLNKQDVLEYFGLLPRDLRSIDAHILDVRPALIVAQRSLIFCSPILRAIIAADRIVLIGTDKDNPICDDEQSRQMADSVKSVLKYLDVSGSASGPDSSPPFELRALEALLLLTIRGLKNISTELQERVYATIPQLRFGVSPAELRELLEVKRTVEDCLMAGRSMQSALAGVLADDDDLAGMYVGDKVKGVQRPVTDHQQAELLLEYYERRLDETSESCERLSSLLAEVDSNISLVLASTRVRLQNLELQTAIGTLALGAGATIAGFFGMNLTSGLEEHPTMFFWVTGGAMSLMVAVTAIGAVRLMRARRSQLFLRSALRHRQDENLTPRWRAGPIAPPSKGGIREVAPPPPERMDALEGRADEGTAGGEGETADGKAEKGEKEDTVEESMKKKDGSQL
ncbi:hypothetical protein JCM11251_003030 [Rhodosporidiobolus azoricus]